MSFGEAVSSCLRKYATFDGRAARPEYWWFSLFTVLAGLVGIAIDLSVHTYVFSLIASLGLVVPTLAVTVRRMHDTGRSGRWLFIVLVPFIGGIWLIVILAEPSAADSSAAA